MGPLLNFLKSFWKLPRNFSTKLLMVSSKYQFNLNNTIYFDQQIIFYKVCDHKDFLIELFLMDLIKISILTASDVEFNTHTYEVVYKNGKNGL